MRPQSLRMRLTAIILIPLLLIACAAAFWQFQNTTKRAEDIFDRGLLSAALAISRDVAVSGGDALSPATRRLVSSTSGGELFYHVYAPDGVFVTGYATPPVPPQAVTQGNAASAGSGAETVYYDAVYQGQNVRVLRFEDATTVDGVAGLFTITVWQDMGVRQGFVQDVANRAFGVIALLVLSVGLVVWFGVGVGLRPLLDLQDAIAKRTPSELEPIRRNVPAEVQGIVSTLNTLLDRVSRRISSKDEFISNAAHQMRNPIAGVLALAEAVENAPTPASAKSRSAELVCAAREASRLTNQLLSFERAKGGDLSQSSTVVNLSDLVGETVQRFRRDAPALAVSFDKPAQDVTIWGDPIMLREALLNLLTNAVVHGGPDLSAVSVTLSVAPATQTATLAPAQTAELLIEDDGVGIDPADHALAMGRFSQTGAGPGSGLGLPIAARVAEHHNGMLQIRPSQTGGCVALVFPTGAPGQPVSDRPPAALS